MTKNIKTSQKVKSWHKTFECLSRFTTKPDFSSFLTSIQEKEKKFCKGTIKEGENSFDSKHGQRLRPGGVYWL